MKRAVLLVSFLIIVLTLCFSDPLAGFLGITFGSTKDQVISAMNSKTTIKPLIGSDIIIYENIKFAGRDTKGIAFAFYKNYFFNAMVIIIPERNRVLESYYAIKQDYYTKYGKPLIDNEEYYSPYEKGDGHEEIALFANKAKINALWRFDEGNNIFLNIYYNNKLNEYEITILYIEQETFNKVQSIEKANNLDDL
jgi:hypothetical protein